eukprot:CAMPEP_0169310900 /NCGR_PEP_ID=MMETSP1017-20121227/3216_1 /TAXON_ID=342587 /ORGANISM="Karlodinium micrum, Strain CCMP2283" /LENGTH=99 /DNA_ID=CAMNT_0009404573 /DNA_START=50 /DNA_END=349 /DNA_ORIENTATION=+
MTPLSSTRVDTSLLPDARSWSCDLSTTSSTPELPPMRASALLSSTGVGASFVTDVAAWLACLCPTDSVWVGASELADAISSLGNRSVNSGGLDCSAATC